MTLEQRPAGGEGVPHDSEGPPPGELQGQRPGGGSEKRGAQWLLRDEGRGRMGSGRWKVKVLAVVGKSWPSL